MKKLLLVSVVGLILSLLALVVTAVPAQFPDNIYLKSRPTMLTLSIIQQNHMLVQFDHVLTDEEKAELSASGINLLNYIPDRAWFIAGKVDKLGKRPDVTYIGAISSESKISPSLSKTWTGNVNILFFSDVPTDVARNILSKYTRTINGPQPGNVWTITATPDAITRLALEDNVMWIEPFPEYQILNDGSRAAIFVNTVQTSPYNLNGTGVSVAEWDAGHAELTHDDFTGHIIAGDSSSTHSHATHVAGTMAGNGNRSAGTLRGMAPNATIITYEWPYDLEELYNETNDSIITYNAILSQNSWGYNVHNNCNEMGDYDIWSAAYDNLTRGNGITRSMLFVFSAGNERATNPPYCGQYGYSWNTTLGPGGTAKNSLTVGALNSNDNSMTSFSSWGPTDDGRIKPDVVAPGCQVGGDGGINSTYPTNTYSVMCGTSMASPAVSGVVALMHQAYRVNHSGADPKPATDKAILIHTAVDQNNTGPDFTTGWGQINATAAIDLIVADNNSNKIILEDSIASGASDKFIINVSSGQTVKLTLVWDDYPGTPAAAIELVNDLDLIVTNSTGFRFYPWTLNASNPNTPAVQTSEDHVNNVEQVYIASATAGLYTIIVNGSIPQSPQNYSLVSSHPFDIIPPDISVLSPGNVTYTTKWVWANVTLNEAGSWCGVSLNGTTNQSLSNSSGNWNLNLTVPADGLNWVQFFCNDTSDNMNVTQPIFFTIDTTSPSINISSPINNSAIRGTQIINVIANDANLNTSTIQLFINGSTPSLSAPFSCSGTKNVTCQFPLNTTNYTDGTYVVNASVNDTANNTGVSLPIFYTIDNTPPNIAIILPTNITYNTRNLPLNFTASGTGTNISWCGYSLNGASNVTIAGCANTTLNVSSDGAYNIQLYANDSAGNMNSSEIKYFSVDTVPPKILNVIVTNITNTSAIILWQTDENANTGLIYGTNSISLTSSVAINNTNTTYHFVNLTGLPSATSIMFQANSTDIAGNVAIDSVRWFMTNNTQEQQINAKNLTNISFNATINDTVQILSNITIVTNTTTNATISLSLMTDNPTSVNISAPVILPRYVSIETNNTLNSSVLEWAVVYMYYNDNELPSGVEESSLRLYRYNGTAWEQLVGGVNITDNYVWGNSSAFSNFGIGGLLTDGQPCTAASQCAGGYCCSGLCASSTCPTVSMGGGGVSGGGLIPRTHVTVERGKATITVPTIAAEHMANVTIEKTEDMAVREIVISVKNTANNIKITIEKLAGKPANVTAEVSGKVYHYMAIDKTNITDADISNVTIKFSVEDSWLTANRVDATNVRLARWSGSQWVELPTTSLGKIGTEYMFSATSPGLSYFAITGKAIAAIPTSACTENWSCSEWSACTNGQQTRTCTDINACGTTAIKPTEIQTCATSLTPIQYWPSIVAIVVIVGIVVFLIWKRQTA